MDYTSSSEYCFLQIADWVKACSPANERRCYHVTTSLIGWAHTWTDPWAWDAMKYILICDIFCSEGSTIIRCSYAFTILTFEICRQIFVINKQDLKTCTVSRNILPDIIVHV